MTSSTYVKHFLWAPELPTSGGDHLSVGTSPKDGADVFPAFQFTESLKSEINSLAALAFSKAEKPRFASETVSNAPSERCLVLSCPTKEGTHILDVAVRHIANKQRADVVVLDALELAAGRLGLLGQEGQVLDEMYASAISNSNKSDTSPAEKETQPENANSPLSERFRAFVDAILRLSSSSSKNEAQPSELSRRIIYFRDFQYIVHTAKPLIAHILQSLHESRAEGLSLLTTILVFGSTNDFETLKIGTSALTQGKHPFLSSLFTHARAILDHRWVAGCPCSLCQPSRESPSLSTVEPIPFNADWGKKVDELAYEKLSISVFAANVKPGTSSHEWQEASRAKKIRRMNQLLVDLFTTMQQLRNAHISVLYDHNNVLLGVENANAIATITMGLLADAIPSPSSSLSASPEPGLSNALTAPSKLFDIITEAYKTFECRKKERAEWEKGNYSTREGNDDDDEEEEGDHEDNSSYLDSVYDDVEGSARDLLGCIINTDKISTEFTDVFVDGAIIDSLKTIVTLPLLYPQYFNTGVLATEAIGGILLYGPPGTGKTMLCRALAKSSRAKMLHIKPSDINDMWLGESEKRVTAVFELARRLAPCIIFIDEIDSLFSSRNDGTKSWERNILTEFMQGMDGLRSAKKNKDSNVVVVGATNRPFDLDLAVLRRMPRRILVDMPNLSMRKAILASYLKNETLHDDVNLDNLAAQTDGFSGSDLKNLCVAAALSSVKEAIGPTWRDFDKVDTETPLLSATSSSKRGSLPTEVNFEPKKGKDNNPVPEPRPRTITAANIAQARNEISRSTLGNTRGDELYKWHEKYSTDGSSTVTSAGKGINRAMYRNSELLAARSALARLNGNWSRLAKGNMSGTGPAVTTMPAPSSTKDE
ncbi:hypothetical protein MD484_g5811, partial [Candolleomyces efflorescens]